MKERQLPVWVAAVLALLTFGLILAVLFQNIQAS
jgi:hypothetical protein